MTEQTLVVATGDYLHTRDLDGLTLGGGAFKFQHVVDKPSHVFRDALSSKAPYDIAEASLATIWMLAAASDRRFVPLPVFTSRMFRWSALYVRSGSKPLEMSAPLRVGMVRFGQTAAVWARTHLRDSMPAAGAQPQWWIAQTQPWLPDAISLNKAPDEGALTQMLLDGALDVLISTRVPAAFGSGRIERLFGDWAMRERQALQAGEHAPVMHALLVRRALVERVPGLADAVVQEFEHARDRAWRWLFDTDKSGLPVPAQHGWLADSGASDDAARVWPYGLDGNRDVLTRFAQLMHEQGLTEEPIPPQRVFSLS
jgi:4,5-dihydroxyphthalate decarboxylase